MSSSILYLLAVMWCCSFGQDIEPRESFKYIQTEDLKLSNDSGHIIPRASQESQEGLMNARYTPCGLSFTLAPGEEQVITSMNYPSQYPNRHRCSWNITADVSLELTCEDFYVKTSFSCKKDYLQVDDGAKGHLRFCGTTFKSFSTDSGVLSLCFKTSKWGRWTGFKCTVTALEDGTALTSTVLPDSTTEPATGESQCTCGRVNRGVRIVGGKEAEVHEYPWQVGMVDGSTPGPPSCGATIISKTWVLTAAHCVYQSTVGSTVVVGEHDYTSAVETSATQAITIKRAISHPGYNSKTMDNDIALLELAVPLEFSGDNRVAPVCLPSDASATYDNVHAIVTGWGTTTSGGSQSPSLQALTLPTMTKTVCRQKYGAGVITDNMICAGLDTGGKDSCQGDSGGPLVTKNSDGLMELIGVVSWGYECALPGYPGVYTRVTAYLSWIEAYVGNDETCVP